MVLKFWQERSRSIRIWLCYGKWEPYKTRLKYSLSLPFPASNQHLHILCLRPNRERIGWGRHLILLAFQGTCDHRLNFLYHICLIIFQIYQHTDHLSFVSYHVCSLKSMFDSPQFVEALSSFQHLLLEGIFDLSLPGLKVEECRTLKRLALVNMTKSKWVEHFELLKIFTDHPMLANSLSLFGLSPMKLVLIRTDFV